MTGRPTSLHGLAPLGSNDQVPPAYLPAVGGGGSGAPGDSRCYLDSYSGTDSSRWDQAYAFASGLAGSSSTTPPIVFPNRVLDISGSTTKAWYDGMRLLGPGRWGDEFREDCKVIVNPNGMFGLPNGSRSHYIGGLSFQSSNWWTTSFARDNSQGSLNDLTIENCGFQVANWLQGTFTRLAMGGIDVNGITGVGFDGGGTDSELFTWGKNFMSGTISSTSAFVKLGMSTTRVGNIYVTAQTGYGLNVNFSYGNLIIDGFRCDCYGRTGSLATQLAGVQVTGGINVIFKDLHIFNTNAATTGKSLGNFINVTGGSNHEFRNTRFIKQYQSQVGYITGDMLYTTVPIVVDGPIPQNWAAGDVKTMRQSVDGLIEQRNFPTTTGRTITVRTA